MREILLSLGMMWAVQGSMFYWAAREKTWSGDWWTGILVMAAGIAMVSHYIDLWRKGE